MEILVLAVLLGLIPAYIAKQKGYSFGDYWIFGTLLFVVALPVALLRKPNPDTRRQCPHCRTWIARDASACPQCTRDVGDAPPPPSETAKRRPWDGR